MIRIFKKPSYLSILGKIRASHPLPPYFHCVPASRNQDFHLRHSAAPTSPSSPKTPQLHRLSTSIEPQLLAQRRSFILSSIFHHASDWETGNKHTTNCRFLRLRIFHSLNTRQQSDKLIDRVCELEGESGERANEVGRGHIVLRTRQESLPRHCGQNRREE